MHRARSDAFRAPAMARQNRFSIRQKAAHPFPAGRAALLPPSGKRPIPTHSPRQRSRTDPAPTPPFSFPFLRRCLLSVVRSTKRQAALACGPAPAFCCWVRELLAQVIGVQWFDSDGRLREDEACRGRSPVLRRDATGSFAAPIGRVSRVVTVWPPEVVVSSVGRRNI